MVISWRDIGVGPYGSTGAVLYENGKLSKWDNLKLTYDLAFWSETVAMESKQSNPVAIFIIKSIKRVPKTTK